MDAPREGSAADVARDPSSPEVSGDTVADEGRGDLGTDAASVADAADSIDATGDDRPREPMD
jgi:hypothetical protein